jgi:hypothetical protein
VLEPEHDALARLDRCPQPLVTGPQVRLDLRRAGRAHRREELRAHRAQLGRGQRRDRPLVQDVAPGDDVADDVRPPHDLDGAIAIGDVQHEASLVSRGAEDGPRAPVVRAI